MSNPITSSQFVRLLDQRLRKVAEDQYKELPSMIDSLYTKLPSDSAWEEFFSVGSLPDIPAFNGKISYLSVSPGYHIKIEPKEFAAGILFERKLLDDKKYAVMDNRAKMLSKSAQRTQEKYGAETFAYAFSSAFEFATNEEGVAWCSDSHSTKSGVSTSSGFDNAGTSALDKTSVEATRILMKKFKGDIGQRIVVEPDTLIVPLAKEQAALELVNTEKGLDTAEGNVNTQYKKWKVIVYDRLDDYDTNNWFMADSSMLKETLFWIDRIPFETNNTVDFDTFQVKHSCYFRIGCGWTDWRGVYGHSVT